MDGNKKALVSKVFLLAARKEENAATGMSLGLRFLRFTGRIISVLPSGQPRDLAKGMGQ